jgi:predicted NBD/HSP70 family sugar kinase
MTLAVGIEIGGTKLQAGIGLRDGKLIALVRRTVDPPRAAPASARRSRR